MTFAGALTENINIIASCQLPMQRFEDPDYETIAECSRHTGSLFDL